MDLPVVDVPVTQFYCGEAPSWWVQVLAIVLYMYIERWLGRTKVVTASSVWDLIVNIFKVTIAKLSTKGKTK